MKIGIADCGSTKCHWAFIENENVLELVSGGFNPQVNNPEVFIENIKAETGLENKINECDQIYFYGAGCKHKMEIDLVTNLLSSISDKSKIKVSHDLDGAVLSLCGNEPGIACILGTGSNAACFDGIEITQVYPALGYILGDPGSGAWIGRHFIKDFFTGKFPDKLKTKLENLPELEDVFQKVYKDELPNKYLASYAKILFEIKDSEYMRQLLNQGFNEFLELYVLPLNKEHKYSVNFTGSIAWFYRDELINACKNKGLNTGKIIKEPIQGLVDFYQIQRKY